MKCIARPPFTPRSYLKKARRVPLAPIDNFATPPIDVKKTKTNHQKKYSQHFVNQRIVEYPQDSININCNGHNRKKVINYLIEECKQFNISRKILFQSMNLFDRCTLIYQPVKSELQHMAASCLIFCTRMNQVSVSQLENLVSQKTIRKYEKLFLSTDFNSPTIHDFLEIIEYEISRSIKMTKLISFIAQLQLQNSGFLRFKPSTSAIASVIFAYQCFELNFNIPLLKSFVHRENYKEVYSCLEDINIVLRNTVQFDNSMKCSIPLFKKVKLPDIPTFLALFSVNLKC